jgi:hypothetical protein
MPTSRPPTATPHGLPPKNVDVATSVRLLTPARAAAHLQVPADELDHLRQSGTGPERGQWCDTVRYDVADVDAWLMRHPPDDEPLPGPSHPTR